MRSVAWRLSLLQYVVDRVLRQNGLHPYHFQGEQQLFPRDAEPGINFAKLLLLFLFYVRVIFLTSFIDKTRKFLAQCRRNATFRDRILWTNKATFTPNSVFNSKNFLIWQSKNPHTIRQAQFQYQWSRQAKV